MNMRPKTSARAIASASDLEIRFASLKEDAMYRSLVAIAVAVIAAATFFAPSAEAGFKFRIGFGGFHPSPSFHQHHKRRVYVVRRVVKKKVVVVKKVVRVPEVVKVIEQPADATVPAEEVAAVESENSSITTAADPSLTAGPEVPAPTAAIEPGKVEKTAETPVVPATEGKQKTASKVDCKKFFPSVGLTLTVPCE
jgi:hypothetical protein